MFMHQKSWKLAIKSGFSVHNVLLYLYWQVEGTKWILCCQKIDVKCAYLRFLMYKYIIITIKRWAFILDGSIFQQFFSLINIRKTFRYLKYHSLINNAFLVWNINHFFSQFINQEEFLHKNTYPRVSYSFFW